MRKGSFGWYLAVIVCIILVFAILSSMYQQQFGGCSFVIPAPTSHIQGGLVCR